MKSIVLFLLTYLFVFLLYEIFIIGRVKRKKRKQKKSTEPMELVYLQNRYKFDMKKVNYNRLLHVIAITSSLDISIVVTVMNLFEDFLLQLSVGFILILLLIFVSYHIVYLIYKKRGLI